MKKSIRERILIGVVGAMLIAAAGILLAEAFLGVPATAALGALLASRKAAVVLATLLLALALVVLGVGCFLTLIPRKQVNRRSGFVMQKTENGAIGISVRSIEGLVQTCVEKHDMIDRADISVAESRDGIIILIDVDQAAGVNIPLAVGVLQKQVRQYVTACTGVEVQEVRVMVENNDNTAVESPYAVQDTVTVPPAVLAQKKEAAAAVAAASAAAAAPAEEPAEASAVPEAPVVIPTPIPPMPAMIEEEEDDRPLHQRLFGAEDEPVFVPAPPEMLAAAEAAPAEAEDPEVEEVPVSETAETEAAEAVAEEAEQPEEAAEAIESGDNDEPDVEQVLNEIY